MLGDTGRPNEQRLTSDVITRGISITGVHDGHNTGKWNNATIVPLLLELMRRGQIDTRGLITHRFSPADVAEAFELATHRRRETMGIVFDWTRLETSAGDSE